MAEKESQSSNSGNKSTSEDSRTENSLQSSPINLLIHHITTTSSSASDYTIIPSSMESITPERKKCASCNITSTDNIPLKKCSKCQSVAYCTRECQKIDFKRHKKTCVTAAQLYSSTANFNMETRNKNGSKNMKEGFKKGLQKWQFDT
ncbi:Zinc finger MYND domain-containing protein 10 [Erysiphe necator]|uniref:Putative mynd domain n=1 Tax=Uncinula necator TaxID=52586 RepID=A0A0B1P4N7_UNCNE|nr:Zinc finger MYND domain-containing protein 10 [Erysiphe necator]KHJ33233.1 putative mynd domain [Erysiphe necator]